jgi:hypothetical protein
MAGQNTKIAALEADAKAARDAAAGSFARAERAEAALTEANAHAEMLAEAGRSVDDFMRGHKAYERSGYGPKLRAALAAHAARKGE